MTPRPDVIAAYDWDRCLGILRDGQDFYVPDDFIDNECDAKVVFPDVRGYDLLISGEEMLEQLRVCVDSFNETREEPLTFDFGCLDFLEDADVLVRVRLTY